MNRKCKSSVAEDIIFGIGVSILISIVSLGFYLQAKSDFEQTKLLKQKITGEQYEKWKQCIDESDGSDASCEQCDEIYNPDKTFIYKK